MNAQYELNDTQLLNDFESLKRKLYSFYENIEEEDLKSYKLTGVDAYGNTPWNNFVAKYFYYASEETVESIFPELKKELDELIGETL